MSSMLQTVLQIFSIIAYTISALILIYITWNPENRRKGRIVVEPGDDIQRAMDKLSALAGSPHKPKSDKWYIVWSLTFLIIGIVFQLMAIFTP
jgi:hypothetical protein